MGRRKPLAAPTGPPGRAASSKRSRARAKKTPKPARGRRKTREDESSAAIAPRRRRTWLRWWLAAILVLATIGAGVDWLVHSSLFRVRHVEVLGLRHEGRGAVLAAAGLSTQTPLIDVSTASVAQRLSVFPWIGTVVVTKRWPSTVEIVVHERKPVAVAFNANHTLQYVDATGHDLGPAPLTANLPTLQYVHPLQRSWPFLRAGVNAALVAGRLPPAFAAQVSVITVNASGSVSLKMTTPVTFILGPPTDLTDKFVSIASVIAHTQLSPGDVVDVRVPGELAVSGPSAG